MKIEVKGPIISDADQWIYDWFEIPATSASKVNKLISQAAVNEELEVVVNSGGGSVFAGSEIYFSLKDYKGPVTVKIAGIAGSAASVIAMAGNKVLMAPTAQLMIHNASGRFEGDYNEMNLGAEILKSINESIANAYKIKTGKEHNALLSMMNHETWLNAQKALELGFIDEIMFIDNQNSILNTTVDKNGLLPREVIDKLRNELKGKNGLDSFKNGFVPVEPKLETVPVQPKNEALEILEIAKAKLYLATII